MALYKRVTLVAPDGSTNELFSKDRRRNRVSRPLRPVERALRRHLKANRTFTETLLGKHDKSRGKRRDGWLRDAPSNITKAGNKAWKVLRRM